MNIKTLKKGQTHVFKNKTRQEVLDIIQKADGVFSIIENNGEGIKIVRLSSSNLQSKVFDICENILPFNYEKIDSNSNYVRVLVCKFNALKGTDIRVTERDDGVYIYRTLDPSKEYDSETLEMAVKGFRSWMEKQLEG